MLDKQKHIDDAVKDKLDGFEISPPPEAWGAIQAASSSTRKKGLWLFFSGLAVGIIVLGVWYFTQAGSTDTNDKEKIAEKSTISSIDSTSDASSNSDNMASVSDDSQSNNNKTSENNNASNSNNHSASGSSLVSNNNTNAGAAANSSRHNNSLSSNTSNTSNTGNVTLSNTSSARSDNSNNNSSVSSSTSSSVGANNSTDSSNTAQNTFVANAPKASNQSNSGSNASNQSSGTPESSSNNAVGSPSQNGSNNESSDNTSNVGGTGAKNTDGSSANNISSGDKVVPSTTTAASKSAMELIVLNALPIDLDLGNILEHDNNSMDAHGRVFPRWRAHVGVGLNSTKQEFDKVTANSSFGEGLDQNSSLSSALNLEAGLAYYLTPGLFVETGYNFMSFDESFGFSYTDSMTTYQIDTVNVYLDSITGDTIYVTDSSAMTNYLSSLGYQENFYKIHSIPLMIGYTFQVGRRWNFDLSGGVNISVFSKFDGRAIQNQQYDLIDLENSHKKVGLLSARAMIRANYLFGEKHGVYIGATLSKHLSSFNNSNLIYDRKLRFIGLSAGYRIIF